MEHDVRRAVALGGRRPELEPVPGLAGAPVPDLPARGNDLHAPQRLLEPERVQHPGAVRADLDSGAALLQLGGLLVALDVEAAPQQRERGREAADAAAYDDDLVWR